MQRRTVEQLAHVPVPKPPRTVKHIVDVPVPKMQEEMEGDPKAIPQVRDRQGSFEQAIMTDSASSCSSECEEELSQLRKTAMRDDRWFQDFSATDWRNVAAVPIKNTMIALTARVQDSS